MVAGDPRRPPQPLSTQPQLCSAPAQCCGHWPGLQQKAMRVISAGNCLLQGPPLHTKPTTWLSQITTTKGTLLHTFTKDLLVLGAPT